MGQTKEEVIVTGQWHSDTWLQEVQWLLPRNCEISEDNGEKGAKEGHGKVKGIAQDGPDTQRSVE